ncbi:MAG TPA: glycosyl hydrolase family 18 [Lachnospiraceae bacterium]|nr:glycosyl hydrolase family 18 [Lachnospiraceae bacterium]
MRKKLTVAGMIVCLVIVLCIIGLMTDSLPQFTPADRYRDLAGYFEVEPGEGEAVMVVNGEVSGIPAWQVDGRWYLDCEEAASMLGSRMYADYNENVAVFTVPQDIYRFVPDVTGYDTRMGRVDTEQAVIISRGEKWGVSLDYLSEYTDFSYTYYEDPSRLVMLADWSELTVCPVKKDCRLRDEADKRAEIVEALDAGAQVYVLEKGDEWTRVMAADGYSGYVENASLGEGSLYGETQQSRVPEYTHIIRDYKISLGWHQMTTQEHNATLEERLANVQGLNVISPTWFTVADNSGNLTSIASVEYVNAAHAKGLEVWGLIDNFSDSVDTLKLLSSTSARTNLINQLISAALGCGLDGINLDFESITEDRAPHYLQFVRELSVSCRNNRLLFSIDDPVPQFSGHYGRREQALVADYVIIMGYDEHYSGSEEAGSNASLPFVEQAIQDTLKEVPASRVINAMPFYTRLWTETYGTGELTSEAMGMDEAAAYVSEHQMETYWDASLGQNVAERDSEEALCQIWLEDTSSLAEKLKLIDKYQLAGGAFWKLGFENAAVWATVQEYL